MLYSETVIALQFIVMNLERRVREAMKHETEPLIIQGGVETFKPTGKRILEFLEMVLVMTTDDPDRRTFSSRYKVPRVLKLAGFEPDIYLNIRDGPGKLP